MMNEVNAKDHGRRVAEDGGTMMPQTFKFEFTKRQLAEMFRTGGSAFIEREFSEIIDRIMVEGVQGMKGILAWRVLLCDDVADQVFRALLDLSCPPCTDRLVVEYHGYKQVKGGAE